MIPNRLQNKNKQVKGRLDQSKSKSSLRSKKSQPSKAARISIKPSDDEPDNEATKCQCVKCKVRAFNRRNHEVRDKMKSDLYDVLALMDDKVEEAIHDLELLVKFKSISVMPEYLRESCKALEWITERLAEMKFRTHLYPVNDGDVNCFAEPQQKVLFGSYFTSPTRNTLLVYGHLDVLPAERDCWLNDPFELNLKDGIMYGRGVTSGKGMIVGWLQAFEHWIKVHGYLPVNVKIIVDMLHEVGSTGLQHYLKAKYEFFLDVDYVLFDTNSWLNNFRPIIACSLCGWAHFGVEVQGANKNLEGGLAGGLVFEPMIDICHLMNELVNDNQEISIPHIETSIKRPSVQEWQLLETADFSAYQYKDELYVRRLKHELNKVEMLQNRWCKPTLTMHGVEGCASRPGINQMLPMKVMGKFSIKLVPDQELAYMHAVVKEHLIRVSREHEIGTTMTVHLLDSCEPSSWSTDSKISKAVKLAVENIYEMEAYMTTGIPINLPIASVFRKLVGKPIILLPYSKRKDRHHQENESVEELCFMQHAKVCASLLYELTNIPTKCKCSVIFEYCNFRGIIERTAMENGEVEEKPQKKTLFSSLKKPKEEVSHQTKDKDKRGRLKKFLNAFGCNKPT